MAHDNSFRRRSLPRGRILSRVQRADPVLEYLIYVPRSVARGAPVFISVHGFSRNASEHARNFAPFCEALGVVLLVPVFARHSYEDYQRLGRRGRGKRADIALNQCLQEVRLLTGADVYQIYLFGYSGGAQFAHRYLMAHPHRVTRAVIAAAGWYTFPDHQRRFPHGIGLTCLLPGVDFNPTRFLHVPVHVIVGANDVGSANLRGTESTNEQQGKTRVDRARNWVAAMQAAAKKHGINPTVSFTEVPEMDHSFTRFCERSELIQRVLSLLFWV